MVIELLTNLIYSLSVSGHSLLKDLIVAFSVLVATVGCWVAVLQKRKAKDQMERMIKDMKTLQQAEDGLQELQLRYFLFVSHLFLSV